VANLFISKRNCRQSYASTDMATVIVDTKANALERVSLEIKTIGGIEVLIHLNEQETMFLRKKLNQYEMLLAKQNRDEQEKRVKTLLKNRRES
jgi:chemotaxis receptor (MCP) glutamine deamidase CheD